MVMNVRFPGDKLDGIHWIVWHSVVGGEARPRRKDWFRQKYALSLLLQQRV